MKLKEFFGSRRAKNGGSAMALVALVVALFYVVNLILLGLASHFSWYFYTTEQYEITVSGAADDLLNGIRTPQGKVKILFCDVEENIKNHQQLDFVYKTATGLAERYPDLLELEFVNMWLEPARLAPYRTAEDGSENTLSSSTVIVDYNGEFVLNSPSAFYLLDEEDYVTAYNGEEVFVGTILWVTANEHPVAYFTANHGEEIPSALYRRLVMAGYRVERLDLASVTDVPQDAGMVVISAPLYDFARAAEGSNYRAELDKLADYLEDDGKLYVSLHPDYTEKLPHLTDFLAGYGIATQAGVLIDREAALPSSGGYSLIGRFPETGSGAALGASPLLAERRTVLSYAAPLSIGESTLATAEALLYAPNSASLLYGGQETATDGATVLALAKMQEGEGVLLVSGTPYLTDAALMNGEGYGNRELVNALLSLMGAERVPMGIPCVMVDRSAIEDLTLGEVDAYATVSVILLPVAIVVGGLIYCRRRKNR
ncbi:MAG: hypothetical protein IJ012_01660 [Clostridia bacterium]|nr:hypothetical protein [Clostridia bacterium]